MIIEFELQGSKCLHKGIFDTTGFWVKYEEEFETIPVFNKEDGTFISCKTITGYKIFSHFSFSFFHEEKITTQFVYCKLMQVLSGLDGGEIEGIGFIRRIS